MKALVIVFETLLPLDIEAEIDEVRRLLLARGISYSELVDSKTWFRETFPRAGDLTSWTVETVNGRDYRTREPHFDFFVFAPGPIDLHGVLIGMEARRQGRLMLARSAQGTAFDQVIGFVAGTGDEEGTWSIKVLEAS